MNFQVVSTQAHAFRAVKRHWSDVSTVEVVFTHCSTLSFVQLFAGVRQFHIQNVCGAEQAVGVFLQTENRRALISFISPHTFKDAHTVM